MTHEKITCAISFPEPACAVLLNFVEYEIRRRHRPGRGSGPKPASLQGLIVIGVPLGTAAQISSIAASVTAMQPSVQSRLAPVRL